MTPDEHAGERGPRLRKMRRRRLLRDVVVFQFKLLVDAAKDLLLSPLSLAAALADLLSPGRRERMLFYSVMSAGRDLERRINLFGTRERGPEPWTVDGVVHTVESRIRDGRQRGATAAGSEDGKQERQD